MRTLVTLGFAAFAAVMADAASADDLAAATFREIVSPKGVISVPQNYRLRWTHVGSWVVAQPDAPGYGFHDVYTQPAAAEAFRRTGVFPDGTVLVKEVRALGSGPLTTGLAQWATTVSVSFVMVKDSRERFPSNPHWSEGWGWALFETKAPLVNVSKGFAESCRACHMPARKTDWVFIEGYPTLQSDADLR